ncbi:MAG: hypothetical protein IKG18_05695 [Atopobiaceae bacterium]|nr:hypothetical protein [Atopobiaceae bacterium]MBR3313616.1 hypothetical protein [Atopobiaceae bacterium]
MDQETIAPEDESLLDNVRKIVGGVATLVALIVPVLIIRKLVKTIEQSDKYKAVENALS